MTLTASPADAVVEDGTLSVTVVDELGNPMPGSLLLVSNDDDLNAEFPASSTFERSLPPGSYGAFSLSPWGGLLCAGIANCTSVLAGVPAVPDGSVVVTSGTTTNVTIQGTVPATLSGPARIGSPLTVTYSAGMQGLVDYLELAVGGSYAPTISWLRDGVPIPGTTGTYVPVGADAGTHLSARLEYVGVAQATFASLSGAPVGPRTTNDIAVKLIATKAFAILSNPTIKAGSRGKVRVELTAPGAIVTGRVTVGVGSWSQTRSLINASVRVQLPKLPAGKHAVKARFLGSPTYAPSTAKPRTLTVTGG